MLLESHKERLAPASPLRIHIPDVHHLGFTANLFTRPASTFPGPISMNFQHLPYHVFHAALPLYAAAELFQ